LRPSRDGQRADLDGFAEEYKNEMRALRDLLRESFSRSDPQAHQDLLRHVIRTLVSAESYPHSLEEREVFIERILDRARLKLLKVSRELALEEVQRHLPWERDAAKKGWGEPEPR
jgi:hypothetical protein